MGQSFHFADRHEYETISASITRKQHHIALKLKMDENSISLDIRCVVDGPMHEISRFKGSSIKGITISQYKVNIGNKYDN